jgi:DNA-binding CsgD family transcriptional regulator/tetratricopeptide (TPR) repeat protein
VEASDEARGGHGRAVLISGEAGVGKSRLLAEFAATVNDFAVAVGHCLELPPAAYGAGPWLEVMAGVDRAYGTATAGELARLLDAQGVPSGLRGRVTPSDITAEVHHHVLRAIRSAAQQRPVFLVLEDLQWSDAASLEMLAFLALNLAAERVVLAATLTNDLISEARDRVALRSLRRSFARMPGYESIHLAPLSESETEALLRSILGADCPSKRIAELVDRSEGNPLFAEQLAHIAEAGGHGIPPPLAELFIYRLDRLPRRERRLLEIIAVAGQPVSADLLNAVTGAAPSQTYEGLGRLIDRRLATENGAGLFSVHHALAAAAIYAHIPPPRRRADHSRIAQALLPTQRTQGVPYWVRAQAARHLEAAGRRAEAQELLVSAANQANTAAAYLDAARCFASAIRLSEAEEMRSGDADILALREAAAGSAFAAGEFEAAITHLRAALEGHSGRSATEIRLRCALGSYLLEMGHDSDAISELESAIGLMPADDPSPQRAHAVGTLAAALMLSGQYEASRDLSVDARRLAAAQGDTYLESQVLSFIGVDLVNLGELDEGISSLRKAVQLAEGCGRTDGALETMLNLASMLIRVDRLDEAFLLAKTAAERADDVGLARRVGAALNSVAGDALIRAGRWREADDVLTAGWRSNPQGKWRLNLLIALARLALLRGSSDDATSYLDAALETEPVRSADTWPDLAVVLGGVELARGTFAAAREAVQGTLGMLASTDADHLRAPLLSLSARIEAEAVLSARRDRRPTERVTAREAAMRIGAALDLLKPKGEIPPGIRAELLTGRAEVSRAVERPTPSLWREAGRLWEAAGRPYEQTYSLLREAEALLQTGSRSSARELLLTGADSAKTLGAYALAQMIQDLVRRARLGNLEAQQARVQRRAAGSVGTTVGELTRREREILNLITSGMTNVEIAQRLFVSPATVATHVSHILSKLGVKSRLEAAAVVGTTIAAGQRRQGFR